MALPMDEQRILEQMERMLAADDPRLAARLAAFGRPGFAQVMRTRRARVTFSVMLLGLVAAVAVVIYMVSALRIGAGPNGTNTPRATPSARQATPARSGSVLRSPGPSGAFTGAPASPANVVHCLATVAPRCTAAVTAPPGPG